MIDINSLESMQKNARAKLAQKHTEIMEKQYAKEIEYSIKNTVIFGDNFSFNGSNAVDSNSEIEVVSLDTLTAIRMYCTVNTAVLNFASYKYAGGGFIKGAAAQEECLCYDSFLYNVLKEFEDSYYVWNKMHLNQSLYANRALYSPKVGFIEDNGFLDFSCDVITCAAPNRSAALRNGATEEENRKALESRLKFVLDIAASQHMETLILGAFGCGVFGQDATNAASIFKQYLNSGQYNFKKVIFAIPKSKDHNYDKFLKVFH